LVLGVTLWAGCGDELLGTCNASSADPTCTESRGPAGERAREHSGCFATWTDNAVCSRTGRLGACEMPEPLHASVTWTVWFYPGLDVLTTADVMARCANGNWQFIPPD
jgi:hypothetical protein